jgi:phosphate/sulfate permease|eukprot:COSAG01_NODE_9411_length_2453_cov_4.475361_1_plen_512_part_00
MAAPHTTFVVVDGGEINIGLSIFFGALLAASNGANDIANSVGTSVGSGVISLRVALAIGCLSEFLGCLLMGSEVSATVGKGVVDLDRYDGHEDLLAIAMTSVLAGAGISTALATAFGLPVSATHGAISGLVAVAAAEEGAGAVNIGGRGGLLFTVLGWVASPLVGALASGALWIFIQRRIFSAPQPGAAAHTWMPVLVGGTVGLVAAFLCAKGPVWIRLPWWGWMLAFVTVGAGTGLVVRWVGRRGLRSGAAASVPLLAAAHGVPAVPGVADGGPAAGLGQLRRSAGAEASVLLPADAIGDASSGEVEEAESRFSGLLVLTGCTVAFAHGGNDVANAVGPLLIALQNTPKQSRAISDLQGGLLLPALGGVCFVVGILLVGSRTIATVGSKITKLTTSTAFAVQSGATFAVLMSNALGLPVSTSHCLIGALIGTGIAGKVQQATCEQGQQAPPELDVAVLKKIALAWVVTIPLAVALALCLYFPLRAGLSRPLDTNVTGTDDSASGDQTYLP